MNQTLVAAVLVISLFQLANGYCCFRDPLMSTPKCGCADFDSPCGVVKCQKICANTGTDACGCNKPACSKVETTSCTCGQSYIVGPSMSSCDCSQAAYITSSCPIAPNVCDYIPTCSCYRDTSNVCYVCDQPTPMCSCLKAASDCGCNDMSTVIYFPEVEYPVVALDMKPFYYGGCYSY